MRLGEQPTPCLLPDPDPEIPGKRRLYRRHRKVWERTHGVKVPAGYHVAHLCGVPGCLAPEHLIIASPAENGRHRTESHSPGTYTEEELFGSQMRFEAGEELEPISRRVPERRMTHAQNLQEIWVAMRALVLQGGPA